MSFWKANYTPFSFMFLKLLVRLISEIISEYIFTYWLIICIFICFAYLYILCLFLFLLISKNILNIIYVYNRCDILYSMKFVCIVLQIFSLSFLLMLHFILFMISFPTATIPKFIPHFLECFYLRDSNNIINYINK